MDHSLQLVLAINRFPGCRGWLKWRVLKECRDIKDLPHAADIYQSWLPASRKRINVDFLLREVEVEIRRLRHFNIQYSILGDSDYPMNLSMICDPPFVLYRRGVASQNARSCIAIVGTRRPTAEGLREAYKLGLEFALCGYPVVSGLAFGIDRAAHEGALDGHGPTWAILAGGLDRPSPYSHRTLATSILNNGGSLLGEMPPGSFPQKYAFPRRNRILSGLCRGGVIVQAPKKSGALITADFALDQGRDIYVGSSGIRGSAFEGTINLEQQGAPVVSKAADVLADWGIIMGVRSVKTLPAPRDAGELSRRMKRELAGRMFRHTGAWFELQSA